MNDDNHHNLILRHDGAELKIRVHYRAHGYVIDMPDGSSVTANAEFAGDGAIRATLDKVRKRASVLRDGNRLTIFRDGRSDRLEIFDPVAAAGGHEGTGGGLTAPMPGKIIAVLAEPGQSVVAGDKLVVMEAMKMENELRSTSAGVVSAIRAEPGAAVEKGAILIDLR